MLEVREATREAEAALLGAILIDSSDGSIDAISHARARLSPKDFITERHQIIYQAMLNCTESPDIIVVTQQLAKIKHLDQHMIAFLNELIALCPTHLHYKAYTDIVKEYSEGRQGRQQPTVRGGVEL